MSEETHVYSYSQVNKFSECPAMWWAMSVEKSYEQETTEAMIQGKIIHAKILDPKQEQGILNAHAATIYRYSKPEKGLKKAYGDDIETLVRAFHRQETFKRMLQFTDHEIELHGKLWNFPFRGFIDGISDDYFFDLKTTRSIGSEGMTYWDVKANTRRDWYHRYLMQLAVYRELIAQNREGDKHKAYIIALTKETPPDVGLFLFSHETLDVALRELGHTMTRMGDAMRAEKKPEGCGHCAYCRETKIVKDAKIV